MVRELKEGHRDMFWYSGKVLKVLKRKPADLDRYDKLLITYYIDGLTSRRLREVVILKFCASDSTFTPVRAVKDMMRYGRRIKERGYKRQDDSDDDEDDEDDSSDEEESNDSDSDSDSDDGYVRRKKKKKRMKRKKAEKAKKKGRKMSRGEGKKKKDDDDDDSVIGEMKELREMIRDLVKAQKEAVTPSTAIVATRPENDIIPLDTYNVSDNYGRYPPPPQPDYYQHGRDASLPTPRRPQYPERRSETLPTADYSRERREVYPPSYPNLRPRDRERRVPPPSNQNVDEPTRRPAVPTRNARAQNPEPQPIVGPDGTLYYPYRQPVICFHCQEEGHVPPQCPWLNEVPVCAAPPLGPEHPDIQPVNREEPPVSGRRLSVNVVEIAVKSSVLNGVKVREVTAAEVSPADLEEFVKCVAEVDIGDHLESSTDSFSSDEEDSVEVAPVMAGERARRFSELPREFDGKGGPASQRPRTAYGGDDDNDEVEEVTPDKRKVKTAVSRGPRKPIRMMAGHEKFDFVGAFRDALVTGLKWGSFFDLAPSVKRDICHLLVQERAKGLERGKGKGKGKAKIVTVDVGVGNEPVEAEEEVLTVASDRHLGDVINFYTKGTIDTPAGSFQVSRILVDAGSVVNLMPIHLLKFIGAKLRKAGGMVIRTVTNALAKIAYCANVRITVTDVACDLRIYTLPEEYKPTYPLLLSRRWLQAVKAKGDYATGKYYIIHHQGVRVQIHRDRKVNIKTAEPGRQPRVPIVMRDKSMEKHRISAVVEEELEWQRSGGAKIFEELGEIIKQEAIEAMRREDEEEGGLTDESEN